MGQRQSLGAMAQERSLRRSQEGRRRCRRRDRRGRIGRAEARSTQSTPRIRTPTLHADALLCSPATAAQPPTRTRSTPQATVRLFRLSYFS